MKRIATFLVSLVTMVTCVHQAYGFEPDSAKEEYYNASYFRYDNYVYVKNIRTALLHPENWELAPPVIRLDGQDKLQLSFDDLDADVKNYYYTIIHCDAAWNPSDISSSEYLEGYKEDQIFDSKPAFNTLQHYTHYNLVFPNEVLKITQAGNYILKVYLNDDPGKYVITKRFMVYEDKVSIQAFIKQASKIEDRNYRQEIDFTINYPDYKIQDPFNDMKVVITQNDRWDNAISNLKPLFVNDNTLTYDYDEDNVFIGGNEFRNFDTKSLLHKSIRIKDITRDANGYQVFLYNEQKITFQRYTLLKDINGKFAIRAENSQDPGTDADYAWVHFTLPLSEIITEGSLYVFGNFADYSFTDENKMKYNPITSAYEAALYLKQGYYDYEYVLLRDGEKQGDCSFIEGTHFETENDYSIYVYNKEFGTGFDKLVGYIRINSNN